MAGAEQIPVRSVQGGRSLGSDDVMSSVVLRRTRNRCRSLEPERSCRMQHAASAVGQRGSPAPRTAWPTPRGSRRRRRAGHLAQALAPRLLAGGSTQRRKTAPQNPLLSDREWGGIRLPPPADPGSSRLKLAAVSAQAEGGKLRV